MKIILVNGPPRSGKDTVMRLLRGNDFGFNRVPVHEKFARPHKEAFAGIMGAEIDDDFNVEPFESTKGDLIPTLGVSYRQWQIDFSEKFMKPLYGKDIFGNLMIRRLEQLRTHDIVIITDCGFQVEVDVLRKAVHMDLDLLLLKMKRAGTSFAGDSRSYVTLDGSGPEEWVYNDGSKDTLKAHLVPKIHDWLRR